MFFEPLVHAGVVDDEHIGVRESLDLLLGSELAATESAEVVDERDGLGALPMGNTTLDDVELLEWVLNEQYVVFFEFEQQVDHAEELTEVGAYFAFPCFHGQVAEVHLLHEFVNVTFRRVGRVHADVVVHLFQRVLDI